MFKKVMVLILTVFVLSMTCLPAFSDECTDACGAEYTPCINAVGDYCFYMCYYDAICFQNCMNIHAWDCINALFSCYEDECGVPYPYP